MGLCSKLQPGHIIIIFVPGIGDSYCCLLKYMQFFFIHFAFDNLSTFGRANLFTFGKAC